MSAKSSEKTRTPAVPALTKSCWIEHRQPFFTCWKSKSNLHFQSIISAIKSTISMSRNNFFKSLAYGEHTVPSLPPVVSWIWHDHQPAQLISLELAELSRPIVQTLPQAKSLTFSPSIDRFKGGIYPKQAFYSIKIIDMREKPQPNRGFAERTFHTIADCIQWKKQNSLFSCMDSLIFSYRKITMGIGQEAKQRFNQGLCETSSTTIVQNDQLPEQADRQGTQ